MSSFLTLSLHVIPNSLLSNLWWAASSFCVTDSGRDSAPYIRVEMTSDFKPVFFQFCFILGSGVTEQSQSVISSSHNCWCFVLCHCPRLFLNGKKTVATVWRERTDIDSTTDWPIFRQNLVISRSVALRCCQEFLQNYKTVKLISKETFDELHNRGPPPAPVNQTLPPPPPLPSAMMLGQYYSRMCVIS